MEEAVQHLTLVMQGRTKSQKLQMQCSILTVCAVRLFLSPSFVKLIKFIASWHIAQRASLYGVDCSEPLQQVAYLAVLQNTMQVL